ncbi:centrosomal protein of 112 kDa-like isoform X2 [Xenopus laevis]|uniref:Centrosomal protein of 112 kDa-like isoform X2 n=1 Tax=Xenopus laevis TaxID=8355 RepID=A0A8J0TUA6_XENLA|nr:centrosomal protein of 112 kDa-like isoform X2 [Xenopus laevis]
MMEPPPNLTLDIQSGKAMGSQEDAWEWLDSEFDHYLVDMKQYVLKLPQRQERQRCALWIKKLCDPLGSGTGITGRKNRNLYAKLLLHMLKRDKLEGPFSQKPEEGMLKALPTYMSIYFDEPNTHKSLSSGPEGLPDWVMRELEEKAPWSRSLQDSRDFVTSPSRCRHLYSSNATSSLSALQPTDDKTTGALKMVEQHKKIAQSFDDSDIEARLNSWNLGIENPRYLREKPINLSPIAPRISLGKAGGPVDEQALPRLQEKKVDMKTKAMEAKFHEEKLRLQQKHDADVQKILDRKNSETEELKGLYKAKQTESEETIRKLEKKVQTLLRESQVIRETKENQISELKKMCEQSNESLKNEWERKLHSAVAEMEQEKFELQKKHTENIQQLLDDTNSRLLKMESDYLSQTRATAQTVKELELRVQQFTVEAESSNAQRQRLSQDKAELDKAYQAVSSDLQESKARCTLLEQERDRLGQDYEKQIQQLKSKYDSDVNYITQQNALQAVKASNAIEDLEQKASQLKQQLQETEYKMLQRLQEQESGFQKEKMNLEHASERKVHELQQKMEEERSNTQRKISKVEALLQEKEEKLMQVKETQKVQAHQADAALEEFKRKVEANSEKVYCDMKQQMEKVEADLSRSKFLREKQSKECGRQLEDLKHQYEQKIVELRLGHEQERTHLFQQHNNEKESIIKDHEKEIDRLEKQLRNTISDHELKTQAWRQRDAQIISELEGQVHHLKEELIQVNSQRKQQLVELGLLRDEEKQKASQEHQMVIGKLKAEMETMRLDLQRAHASQMEEAMEKANSRFKHIEKEYSDKLAKSMQMVNELQLSISSGREENNRQQFIMDRRLQEATQRHEEEKRQLIKDNKKAIKVLKDEVETYSQELRATEKKLQEKELSAQEQVTQIRQDYELKIKGFMPATVRQELEDTITSLKSQVNFLQKRAQVLQEDLDIQQSKRL